MSMVVVCAWCNRLIRGDADALLDQVSHGMCHFCFDRVVNGVHPEGDVAHGLDDVVSAKVVDDWGAWQDLGGEG